MQRLEEGGWRFKRSRSSSASSAAPLQTLQRALSGLATGSSRPIAERPRTLLERVLQRDFAGVRVQMASLGPLGIAAAAQGNTVYLSREQARLDSPQALALLGHELTHVAAGGAAPLLAGERVQRAPDTIDLPLAHALAPSLTRRLSRQLVQMSLAEEENVAEQVENAVRRSARTEPAQRASASGYPSAPRRPSLPTLSIDAGSRSVASLAQRRLASSRFAPVSQSWPAQDFASAVGPAAATATVDLLEERGWRFKRSERLSAAPAANVQRAAAELSSGSSGGMPLPLRPRTLMERVLQRDFSAVRLQAVGLQPLGVEAAAHGQTVYMQRSTLAQLERPDNLALLGHELTHVAAGTNPPVRRSELNGQTQMDGGSPVGVLPLALPPLSQLQRSLQHEESAAAQVEQGIHTLLRQNASAQREPLSPRAANGPVKAQSAARVAGAGVVNGRQGTTGDTPRLKLPAVQRSGQEGAVLGGVPTEAMPVVQRAPERQTESVNGFSSAASEMPRPITRTTGTSTALAAVQRVAVEPEDDGYVGDTVDAVQEADWDRLADKIYPLIKRMLQMERERRPL